MSDLVTYLQTTSPQFRRARLASLYSDFRSQKTLNPDGYTANISAWLNGLSSATLAGLTPSASTTADRLTLSVNDELLRVLDTKQWGRPLALGTVVREGKSRGALVEEKVWGKATVHKGLLWKVAEWGLGFVLGLGDRVRYVGEDWLPVGRYVVLGNLEEAAKALINQLEGIKGRTERIFARKVFEEQFRDVLGVGKPLSERDMDILLLFLQRDKGILVYDEQTVKLVSPGERKDSQIMLEDTTIASLKTLITDMEAQTTILTKRIDELNITAKQAVERKNRISALAALKSKKITEQTLMKRHATLSQLEEVFSKIGQAADQVELVRIMESSTRVLSGLNKEVGGEERVVDVMEQLREQMGQVDEVGNVIVEIGKDAVVVDEREVDDELEAMEREEREKTEAVERKEGEEREKKEAKETRRRLDTLEEVERKAARVTRDKELKEAALKPEEETNTKRLNDSTELMGKLSL